MYFTFIPHVGQPNTRKKESRIWGLRQVIKSDFMVTHYYELVTIFF